MLPQGAFCDPCVKMRLRPRVPLEEFTALSHLAGFIKGIEIGKGKWKGLGSERGRKGKKKGVKESGRGLEMGGGVCVIGLRGIEAPCHHISPNRVVVIF